MAQTQVPNAAAYTLPPTGPSTGTVMNPVYQAADIVNGNYFVATGSDLVTVWNTDSAAHNLSVTSAPDASGRLANITNYALPPNSQVEFLVVASSLYTQTTGQVLLSADNVAVKFYVRAV
jgi:hypothetical protein